MVSLNLETPPGTPTPGGWGTGGDLGGRKAVGPRTSGGYHHGAHGGGGPGSPGAVTPFLLERHPVEQPDLGTATGLPLASAALRQVGSLDGSGVGPGGRRTDGMEGGRPMPCAAPAGVHTPSCAARPRTRPKDRDPKLLPGAPKSKIRGCSRCIAEWRKHMAAVDADEAAMAALPSSVATAAAVHRRRSQSLKAGFASGGAGPGTLRRFGSSSSSSSSNKTIGSYQFRCCPLGGHPRHLYKPVIQLVEVMAHDEMPERPDLPTVRALQPGTGGKMEHFRYRWVQDFKTREEALRYAKEEDVQEARI